MLRPQCPPRPPPRYRRLRFRQPVSRLELQRSLLRSMRSGRTVVVLWKAPSDPSLRPGFVLARSLEERQRGAWGAPQDGAGGIVSRLSAGAPRTHHQGIVRRLLNGPRSGTRQLRSPTLEIRQSAAAACSAAPEAIRRLRAFVCRRSGSELGSPEPGASFPPKLPDWGTLRATWPVRLASPQGAEWALLERAWRPGLGA